MFVDVGSEREYTATLLSSQSNEQQEAMLDSVLVVSFRGGHPHNFSITCRSHLSSMTVSAQNVSAVLSTATDHEKNVALDHVVLRGSSSYCHCRKSPITLQQKKKSVYVASFSRGAPFRKTISG